MSFVVRPYQLGWNLNLPVTYHDKQRHHGHFTRTHPSEDR
jgi:hypothetical protein